MENSEGDEFASADEGFDSLVPASGKPASDMPPDVSECSKNIPKVVRSVKVSENSSSLSEPGSTEKSKHKKPRRRKRHAHSLRHSKEIPSGEPPCKNDTTHAAVEPLNSWNVPPSDTYSLPTEPHLLPKEDALGGDRITFPSEKHEDPTVLPKLRSAVDVRLLNQKTTLDDGIWDRDALSSAASTIVRGVGDGITSLAGVLGHVLSTEESDELKDKAQRRRRRKAEEEAHQRTISEAWSSVWNAAWGDDDNDDHERESGDGWEVEHPVPIADSKTDRKPENESEHNISPEEPLDTSAFTYSIEKRPTDSWSWAGVSSFAHQLTSSFHEKGLHLVQGSVGVLEKIGRKTMSVLEENDPGFQYTKKFIRPPTLRDQPNLSQAIREARERMHSNEVSGDTETSSASRHRGDFTYQLEVNRGLVHLEALELVSYQAESKLHVLLTTASSLHDGPLEVIWESLNFDDNDQDIGDEDDLINDETVCSILSEAYSGTEENDDLSFLKANERLWIILQQALAQLNSIYSGHKFRKLLASCLRSALSTENEESLSQHVHFFTGISVLAEIISGVLEYLHKLAECLLVHTYQPDTDFILITKRIAVLLRVIMKLKTDVCTDFVDAIKKAPPSPLIEVQVKPASTSQLIANTLLECGNAQNYLNNAARLVIPVLQLAYLVNRSDEHDDRQDNTSYD